MQTPPPSPYRIELFGELRVLRGGDVALRLRPQKPAVLLACLALFPDREHARDALMERLWPEVDPVAGRNRLKQTLAVLRGDLEAAGIAPDDLVAPGRVALRLTPGVATDVAEFAQARRAALQAAPDAQIALHERAVALAHAELLPAFYDDWVALERETLAEEMLESLLALLAAREAAGRFEEALPLARRAVRIDPYREEAHSALMRIHAALGHPEESLRQYQRLEKTLRDGLGEAPSPASRAALESSLRPRRATPRLEPVGGAVPLASAFYVVRSADAAFADAIAQRDSIVLVKGPRQIGKTSLLARGLQQARDAGARVVLTDLQRCTRDQMASADTLFRHLADSIVEQLDMADEPGGAWDSERGWNVNFERFLRRGVLTGDTPFVWGVDEVDRLFSCDYGSEVFGLFRSWHNLRSLHPAGPWSRLTLAMAYATEAHLFITDLNQSPFNVGTRLTLEDFTREQVADLNRRYGSPLRDERELAAFFALVGGSPYLVRRGLHEMASQPMGLDAFARAALADDGPFHDHLGRLVLLLDGEPSLRALVVGALRGEACADPDGFYRLRSAGVLLGEAAAPRLRCRLYADWLGRRLT